MLEVVLFCPNSALLINSWAEVAKDILRPKNKNEFIKNICQMAKALGEINRYHSKTLPDKYFFILQKRMTELRRIVGVINKRNKTQGKPPIIPWQQLEYFFSAEERKELKQ